MAKIQFSKQNLCVHCWDPAHLPGPLTDLARIVSSSQPPGSVDADSYLDKHGYEQLESRSVLRG